LKPLPKERQTSRKVKNDEENNENHETKRRDEREKSKRENVLHRTVFTKRKRNQTGLEVNQKINVDRAEKPTGNILKELR
jgi:hypothetical protein